MSRESAIEAGGRALRSAMYPDVAERLDPLPVSPNWLHIAAAVIDAAAPYLAGEPIGWVGHIAGLVHGEDLPGLARVHATRAAAVDQRVRQGYGYPEHVYALVPVEDQP